MSGLDVAAGVVGIASAGIVVAKGLIQIAESIGSAGEEVRMCAAETTMFSRMLNDLSDALTKPIATSRATHNTTEDLIDICERILKPFEALIERLNPLLENYRNSEHQLRQLSLRIQWFFRHKSKVTFYQQALGRLKLTLTCLLASMNLQEAKVNEPRLVFIYQAEVRISKASVEQRQQADRAKPLESASEVQIDGRLLLSEVVQDQDNETQDTEVEKVAQDSDQQVAIQEESSNEALSDITSEIDEDPGFETATAVHDDLLSLQRKVLRIAENTLKPANLPAIMQREQSTVSQVMPEDPIAEEPDPESSSRLTPSLSDDRSQSPTSETDKPVIFHDPFGTKFALPYSKCRTWDSTMVAIRKFNSNYYELVNEIVRGEVSVYLESDVIISWRDWASIVAPGMSFTLRLFREEPAPPAIDTSDKTAPGDTNLSNDERKTSSAEISTIQLTDSRGIIYDLPFRECQTLMAFEKVLALIYDPSRPQNNKYYTTVYDEFEGDYRDQLFRYTVYRDGNICIPLPLWQQLVRPGWKIQLKFDDARLNEEMPKVDPVLDHSSVQTKKTKLILRKLIGISSKDIG